MKKEKQHIIDLIYQLDFENAAKHLFQLSKEEQISLMVCEAADKDSIIILGFLCYDRFTERKNNVLWRKSWI